MDNLLFIRLGFLLIVHLYTTNTLADQNGFLSLTCGGMSNFVDELNISWIPDGPYVTKGITTSVSYIEGSSSSQVPLRFFPNYEKGRKCYRIPAENISSTVLVRAQFYYKNYDGLDKPPVFSISLGTAVTATVNLTNADPWAEEFIWPVTQATLPLCLHSIPGSGYPVISSLEIRPLPEGAYGSGLGDSRRKTLRKSYRVNCGYTSGSIRFPEDSYDRVWDADQYFIPPQLTTELIIQLPLNVSGLREFPPIAVLQSARVLARRNDLSYNFPLDKTGDYYVVLYFAGVLPVSPTFNILINGNVMSSDFTVKRSEVTAIFFTQWRIRYLNITLKNVSYYPSVNAIEVYELVDIPLESSSTTVSALQVIQQSTGLELGWEDDPCFPAPWTHIGCEGDLVTSLDLSGVNLRSIIPTFGDLQDLKTLDLHNTSLTGEVKNLASLQELEKLNDMS